MRMLSDDDLDLSTLSDDELDLAWISGSTSRSRPTTTTRPTRTASSSARVSPPTLSRLTAPRQRLHAPGRSATPHPLEDIRDARIHRARLPGSMGPGTHQSDFVPGYREMLSSAVRTMSE